MNDQTPIQLISPFKTVILANGAFPVHPVPVSFLHQAEMLICCDGAVEPLLRYGMEPHYIVGDLDSISQEVRQRYQHCLRHDPDQEINDLTKSVQFCIDNRCTEITILGATGAREDHSIANISLLADYASQVQVQMITDYGVFVPILHSAQFESYPGQQVSIFSLTPDTIFDLDELAYPLTGKTLSSWWQGSLNEACGNSFSVGMDRGKALIFREHRNA